MISHTRAAATPGHGVCGWVELYAGFCTAEAVTIIHLGLPLPTTSSGLPGYSGGQPSNATFLTLLQVGFT